ncbi:MAG: twin-arginine translocation signal domain-containing protein [Pseudomonadota bacterium]|nr:twin-arginine translocation signal domain-containing protein [Pseudomonadota bacterium]
MITRRSFLTGTTGVLCGTAVLPAWAGLLNGLPFDSRSVLLLSDRPSPRFPGFGIDKTVKHRPLSLDIAADIASLEESELSADNHSALVAFGTPASIFALRTQLSSRWRVVVRGMHGARDPSLHELNAPASLTPSLARALVKARNEDDFTRSLLALDVHSIDVFNQKQMSRLHQGQRWVGPPRASLLALTRRQA